MFFHSTKSLFLPLPHQHPSTKAQRQFQNPLPWRRSKCGGKQAKGYNLCLEEAIFLSSGMGYVTWNKGTFSLHRKAYSARENGIEKKQSSFNGQQVTFTDILKCSFDLQKLVYG